MLALSSTYSAWPLLLLVLASCSTSQECRPKTVGEWLDFGLALTCPHLEENNETGTDLP